jgi:hypothetical protein
MAMDKGLVNLDTPIINEYLPNFRMMDKQVTTGILDFTGDLLEIPS